MRKWTRNILVAAVTVALATPIAYAQETLIKGEVTKVDESAGKITIKHEAIKKFEMESMTMVFRAADPAMLKLVKPGDKVQFVPDKINGQFTVTKIEKAK